MDYQEVIDILRRIRHDFANHLQVISGFIELERCDDAFDYIHSVHEQIFFEGRVFELSRLDTALYLYQSILTSSEMGIKLRYKDLDIKSHQVMKDHQEPYVSLSALSEELSGHEEKVVYMSLYESPDGMLMRIEGEGLETSIKTIGKK